MPAVFQHLPDHAFWNSQPTHDPVRRDSSLASPGRKMSRKLPPVLTESLEDLSSAFGSSISTLSASASPLPREQHLLSVDAPSDHVAVPALRGSSDGILNVNNINATKRVVSAPQPTSISVSAAKPLMRSAAFASHPSISSIPPSLSCSSSSTCGTWSVLDEIEMAEHAAGKNKMTKEDKRLDKQRRKLEDASFDAHAPPTVRQLFKASLLEVVGERGERVRFGDLVRQRKTVVIFIRHWFCPLCAQYMDSILAEVSQEALELAEVDLILIGNGSDKMLSGYRNKAFKCPFKMYTDPTLRLYRALGLTRQTYDAGDDADKGDYLVLNSFETTKRVMKRAVQMMPIRNPGHFSQLGGEFVFDGVLNVLYTHRMTTTRSHAPIRQVVAEAGVGLAELYFEPGPSPPPIHRESFDFGDGQRDWRDDREDELARIRHSKLIRRGFIDETEMGIRHSEEAVVVEANDDRDVYAQGMAGAAR